VFLAVAQVWLKKKTNNCGGVMQTITKHCPSCNSHLSLDNFHNSKKSKDGKYSTCKTCKNIRNVVYRKQKKEGTFEYKFKGVLYNNEFQRWCSVCKTVLPIEDFYTKDDSTCSGCHRVAKGGSKDYIQKGFKYNNDKELWCSTCKSVKPIEEFTKSKGKFRGRSHICKPCQRERYSGTKEYLHKGRIYNNKNQKYCKKCDQVLPVSEFNKNCTEASGLQIYCKECNKIRQGKRTIRQRQKRWEYFSETVLQTHFGLCVKCLNTLEKWHLDHIVPDSLGGDDAVFNRQIMCESCNCKKLNNESIDYRIFLTKEIERRVLSDFSMI
jgi:uncharacterized protein YbaR (Trm112 family)